SARRSGGWSSAGGYAAGRDVVAKAEDVVRVVAVLEPDEAVVLLGAVGLAHAFRGVVEADVVDVHAAAAERPHRCIKAARVAHPCLVLAGILPVRGDEEVEYRVAMAIGHGVLRHARDRPTEREEA